MKFLSKIYSMTTNMDIQEQTLLKEIKSLYEKLEQNVRGEYRGSCKIGEPGFSYQIYANELLKKVSELHENFHPDYLDKSDISALMHTIDKEVAFVEYHYQEILKPNASRKKIDGVCAAIHKANKQIKLDLFGLFREIEKL